MLPDSSALAQLDLRDYVRILRNRKWVIVVATLVVVGASLLSSFLQTPVYAATAKVLVQPGRTDSAFSSAAGQVSGAAPRDIGTELEVINSEPVHDAVSKKLGFVPSVSASGVGQTDVVKIRSENVQAARASAGANAYAAAYIDYRRKQAIDELLAAGEQIQGKVDDLQKQIDDLSAQIADAPICGDAKVTPAQCAQRTAIEQTVTPRRTALINAQELFKQRLDQLQVDSALKTGGAQMVTPAATPVAPFKPNTRRNVLVGILLGMVFGVGVTFFLEYLDDSVKDKEDVERVLQGVPVLGLIPVVAEWKSKTDTKVISLSNPRSSTAEAYRTLRTSIQFLALDHPARTIQVTSPSAQEGKSTTVANLGVALARAGQRVIVVCCDLRRPRLHLFFDLTNEIGFTSVLLGEVSLAAAVQKVPGVDRLMLLASGPVPANPSELLSSQHTLDLLSALRAQCDVVLLDSPPVLPVTDSLVLSRAVDATLIASSAGTTTKRHLARTKELLDQVNAPVVGAVLNQVPSAGEYGYAYYEQVRPIPTNGRGDDENGSNGTDGHARGAHAQPAMPSYQQRPRTSNDR